MRKLVAWLIVSCVGVLDVLVLQCHSLHTIFSISATVIFHTSNKKNLNAMHKLALRKMPLNTYVAKLALAVAKMYTAILAQCFNFVELTRILLYVDVTKPGLGSS